MGGRTPRSLQLQVTTLGHEEQTLQQTEQSGAARCPATQSHVITAHKAKFCLYHTVFNQVSQINLHLVGLKSLSK